ncbi:MAG: MarR family winged helix-turn-helix transcriptional regulator [Mycobacterium sp.]
MLSQLGFHVAARAAEVFTPLGFAPPHFEVLTFVERYEGQTQQRIAEAVGANRNTMVAIIDDLERLGLAQRQPHPSDRRANAVHLTKQGRAALQKAWQLAAQYEQDFTAELDPAERETLVLLLRRLADGEGLSRGVHPGLVWGGENCGSKLK